MALTWKLRDVLIEKCGIRSASELRLLLEQRAGATLSLQSVFVDSQQKPGCPPLSDHPGNLERDRTKTLRVL
jgi:hypothetical protein